MDLPITSKPDFLESGERARLIPVNRDSQKEGRITSCVLASFMSVDELAQNLLASIKVKLGKRAKIECFTEIVFKNKNKSIAKLRPDGLIIITNGKKQWMALIEAKVDRNEHQPEQIEAYLDLAKIHNINAIITLSNQFAITPSHPPVNIKKSKLKNTSLYHWSWSYIAYEAAMLIALKKVEDPDQAYILEELLRFLKHNSSGILPFERMGKLWKDMCYTFQNQITPKKTSLEVVESIASWHQYVRDLSLRLGETIGEHISIKIKNDHKDNLEKRLDDDATLLISKHCLTAEFDVPRAANKIKMTANVSSKSITVSMYLKAPKERATTKGRINWITNQLKSSPSEHITIRALWAGRAPDTVATLSNIKENGFEALVCENKSLKPSAFEIALSLDLGAKFKGAKTFVQESQDLLLTFYEQAGQLLKEWVPPPLKIKTNSIAPLPEDINPPSDNDLIK